MGNVLAVANDIKGDPAQDDLKWLSVENSALFHDSYVTEHFDGLPAFKGTELPAENVRKDDDKGLADDPRIKRLLEILYATAKTQTQPSVAEVFDVEGDEDPALREFTATMRMRSRIIQRIHLAIIRESQRVKAKDSKKGSGDRASSSLQSTHAEEVDPASLLTMASMRISLSLLKTLRGSNPAIFTDMCESLMALLELSPTEALSKVNANRAQRETLQQIADFAATVASTSKGVERSYALALIFALGVSRGSVRDLLQVVSLLTECQEPLPSTAALAPFWKRLLEYKHNHSLVIPNMFLPDGDEVNVKTNLSQGTEGEGRKAAIATDGTHLYIWNIQSKCLEKVGTGLHGTIAGTVYESTKGLMHSIRPALGLGPEELASSRRHAPEGAEEKEGDEHDEFRDAQAALEAGGLDASAAPQMPSRPAIRVLLEAPIFAEASHLSEVLGLAEQGDELEVLQQFHGDDDSDWVRTAQGWVCMRSLRSVMESESDDEEDEEDEDEDTDDSGPSPRSDASGPVYEVIAGTTGGAAGAEGSSATGATAQPADSGVAWLCCIDGKLYLKLKCGMGPLDYAIISAHTLKLEGMGKLVIPSLEGSEAEQQVESSTDEPTDNYADEAQGATVSAFVGGANADATRLRNLLLPAERRTALEDGTTRFIVEGSIEAPTQTIQLDLGSEARSIHRIGIHYEGRDGDAASPEVLSGVIVSISADGTDNFVDFPGTAPVAPFVSPIWVTTAAPVEARSIRITLVVNVGSIALTRVYACGSLEGTRAERVIPALVSDGRSLLAVHVAKARPAHAPVEGDEDVHAADDEPAIEIHTVRKESGDVLTTTRVALEVDQAALHKHTLATNGHQLLLLQLKNADARYAAYKVSTLGLADGDLVDEKEFSMDGNAAGLSVVPQVLTYDLWNNYIWGVDPSAGKFTYWRNVGLPPRFHPAKPSAAELPFSAVAAYRLEGLSSTDGWQARASETSLQAAKILSALDRCGEIYAPPAKASLLQGTANEISVSNAGRDDGNTVKFLVRGQNVGSTVGKGFNFVRLDEQYQPVDTRTFDTTIEGGLFNELMMEWVSQLPDSTVVLVASREEATRGLSPLGKRALRALGADHAILEKLELTDLYVLVGRKGAKASQVSQKVAKYGASIAVAKQIIPLRTVPLAVEPTPQTIKALYAMIMNNKAVLLKDDVDEICQVQMLSTLRVMTTNTYQLGTSAPLASAIKDALTPSELNILKECLLDCIEKPRCRSLGARAVSEAALQLFVNLLDALYPTPTQRCQLLISYMNRFTRGVLSSLEASVLSLLLKRISTPSSLLALLDESSKSGSSSAFDLFQSVLNIAKGEVTAAIRASTEESESVTPLSATHTKGNYEIGQAATSMLSSLCSHLLSQTVQSIVLATEGVTVPEKDRKPGADATGPSASDMDVLLKMVTLLAESSQALVDAAIDVSTATHRVHRAPSGSGISPRKDGSSGISRDVESILRNSPVGALLPLVVFTLMDLVRYHSPALLPALSEISKTLTPLMEKVRRVIELLPQEKRRTARSTLDMQSKKKTMTYESEHPYRSNLNETTYLMFPRAERIVVVFSEESKTEPNYDYLIFWKDATRTEKWHQEDRYSGRGGNENFPGCGGRPPLIIHGDYAEIEWHSDASNEDWGWRFTATAEYKKQTVYEELHWLVQLDTQLNACGAALSNGLTVSVPWLGDVEERNVQWMEDEVLSSHNKHRHVQRQDGTSTLSAGAGESFPPQPLSPKRPTDESESVFLESLVTRPHDSAAAKLVQRMRKLVKEDRGNFSAIDDAVYASIAALIKHNGLTAEAMAVAQDSRPDMPEALVRVWKSGVKMRHYFSYGDLHSAQRRDMEGSTHLASVLERGPSIYSGAEDSVIEQVSKKIVEKARFLLKLDGPRTAKSFARKRWALLSQFGKAHQSTQGPDSRPGTPDAMWAAVVEEIHASYKLKSIIEYRRKAADRRKASNPSVTERLLRFLQADVKIEELETVKELRTKRAAYRAEGIQMVNALLQQTTSRSTQIYLLTNLMRSLRQTRHSKDGCALTPHVHYLNGCEGCDLEAAARLSEAFSGSQKTCVQILRTCDSALTADKSDLERKEIERLIISALEACSLDYDVHDHAMIEDNELVSVLSSFLTHPLQTIRLTAWKAFETLLPRAMGIDEKHVHAVVEEPTNVSKQLLALVIKQLEQAAQACKDMVTAAAPADTESMESFAQRVVVLDGTVQLDRDMVGYVAPHIPVGINSTFSFWLWRTKGRLDDEHGDWKPKEGSRVRRGPHWSCGNQDGGQEGTLGTVTRVDSSTMVTVRWDGQDSTFSYRFGEVNTATGEVEFDVVVVDEGVGGSLVYKGTPLLLDEKQRTPWSAISVSLTDTAKLQFSAARGKSGWFRVMGKRRVPAETWTHVAVTMSKEKVVMYLDGEDDVQGEVESAMLQWDQDGGADAVVETPHPYTSNMDQTWTVEVPDAESYTITFDEATRTERNYDYVSLQCWDDPNVVYGEQKYSGGLNGSERTFPGVDGTPALTIDAPRFKVFFHSDGSNEDWGFKLTAVPKLAPKETAEPAEDDAAFKDLNPSPLYIGQTPSYVSTDKGAQGLLTRLSIHQDTLTPEQVHQLAKINASQHPSAPFHDMNALNVLSLLDKSLRVMPTTTVKALASQPSVLEAVLRLSTAPVFHARIAATRMTVSLLPHADPIVVDMQVAKIHGCPMSPQPSAGPKPSLVRELLMGVGEVLSTAVERVTGQAAVEGAESAFAMTYQRLRLLQALAKADAWASVVRDAVADVLKHVPEVLRDVEKALTDELARGEEAMEECGSRNRQLLTAVVALLGGYNGGISVGSEVLVELEEKQGVFEEATVLALTHAPQPDWEGDKEKARKLQKEWEGSQGFGDAVLVVIHSDPQKAVIYPRTKLVPLPLRDNEFLSKVVEGVGADVVLSSFKELLQADLSPRVPTYKPKTVEEDRTEVIDSDHPYNMGTKKWKLDFPGADRIEITFEEARTDFGNDYVKFMKDGKADQWWGEEKYHGRDRQQNWPGLQGRPPLIIPAASATVIFTVNSDSNDWGFRLTAKAHCVTTTQPPERPPLRNYAALLQLYLQSVRALSTVIEHVPSVVLPASKTVTQLLVQAALKVPEASSSYTKKAESLELETNHPYDCNEDRYENISFPGATMLKFVFDERSMSERGCDFMRIFKDDSRTEFWVEQLSGGKDGSSHNWPGLGGNPPLEILSDHCTLYWHTDGSVVDWGWKVTITPEFSSVEGMGGMSTTEVLMRTFYMSEYLYDHPRAQVVPKELESFEALPPSATTHEEAGKDRVLTDLSDLLDESTGVGGAKRGASGSSLGAKAEWDTSMIGRKLVVNFVDAENVMLRAAPCADVTCVGVLGLNTPVTVVEESCGWLKVRKDASLEGWALWSENDLTYLVDSEGVCDGMLTIPHDDADAAAGGSGAAQAPNRTYECSDEVSAAGKPLTVSRLSAAACLTGQTARLSNALAEATQWATVGYAKQSVAALLNSWPEEQPFSLELFGGAQQFIRFIRDSFMEDRADVQGSRRLNVIKQKILQVLRDGKEDSQVLTQALVTFSVQQLKEASEMQGQLSSTKAVMTSFETPHPYLDNTDLFWPVSFPGAKRLKIVFDAECSTEHNCDYIVIFKSSDHSQENRHTMINYTGRASDVSNKIWPGVGGRPPLYIDSDSCEIQFHSDGSNVDWGVKVYVYGIMEEPSKDDVEAYREKRRAYKGVVELACWLLEFIAPEPLPAVREGVYAKTSIRILRKYLEAASPTDKLWIVHLISSILSNLSSVTLAPDAVAEVKKLIATLRELTLAQFKTEENVTTENKSSLLQALVQAWVLGESSNFASPEYLAGMMSVKRSEEEAGGFEETKEQSRDTSMQWAAQGLPNALTLSGGNRVVTCAGSSYASVMAGQTAARNSVYTWRVKILDCDTELPPFIGLASSQHFKSTEAVGQAPNTLGWYDGKLMAPGRESVLFGPKVKAGDVVTVEYDSRQSTLTYYRNGAKVGVAFGPPDSGAAFEVPDTLSSSNASLRLAVSVAGRGSVRLLAPNSLACADPTLAGTMGSSSIASSADPSAAAQLEKVRECADYMRAFAQRTIPTTILRREFLTAVKDKNKVTIESAHPFDSTSLDREVVIPGACALEVRFDWQSSVREHDVVRITGAGDQELVFKGMQHGTDASAMPSGLCAGDLVVRGSVWRWGNQDGGAGSIGEVLEIRDFKGKTNAGALVRWQETDHTGLYRTSDLAYFAPGNRCTRPITIFGDSLRLSVATKSPVEAATSSNADDGWRGALNLVDASASVRIAPVEQLELTNDFTVDAWVRPSNLSGKQTILSRALEGMDMGGDVPPHQIFLRVQPDGQLALSMQNGELEQGVNIQGGRVLANRWTHVAASVHNDTVRLYVDGTEVASSAFSGSRMNSLGAPLVIGNVANTSEFKGHMYDVRVFSEALPSTRIHELSKTFKPSSESLLRPLVSRWLHEPIYEGGDVAINSELPSAVGQILGCAWDVAIEAPGRSNSSVPWGYKVTILPIYGTSNLEGVPNVGEEYTAFAEAYAKGELKHDLALVRYVNRVTQQKGFSADGLLTLKWEDIAPAEADTIRLPLLKELMSMSSSTRASSQHAKTAVQCRYVMVQHLNVYLRDVLPLLDLGSIDKPWSMAALVSRCRGLIYTTLKGPMWQGALNATTASGSTFELRLSRSKALKYTAVGRLDEEARYTVFAQAFRQIHPMPPRTLRRGDKLYNVIWMGERAHDAGGPYRETWSVYCSELQSPSLPLLRRTQNGVHSIGQNREQWVLNPGATSAQHLELFGFLGKLMGIVIRNGEYLNLDLSPVVWKLLANDNITLEDLELVDVEFVRSLRTLRTTPEEEFGEAFSFLDFTTQSTDERTVELIPGGASQQVTYANRLEYVRLLEEYRLSEFNRQAEAVRAGMASIVPTKLLALFTWEEIEMMVCGQKQVDVDLLKRVTEYSGCRSEDPHVKFFWDVLEGFTDEERSMFLRFCWGRSRLPLRADAFPQTFKLQSFMRSPADNFLPVSHTCFFSLELPAYSTQEIMQNKLTYAIFNCQAIDGDDTTVGMQAASMGWEE